MWSAEAEKMMESAQIEDQAAPDSAPNVDTPSKDYQSNDKTTNGHATPTRDTTANGDITTLDQSEYSPSDKQVDSDSNSHSFVTLSPPTSPGEWVGLVQWAPTVVYCVRSAL